MLFTTAVWSGTSSDASVFTDNTLTSLLRKKSKPVVGASLAVKARKEIKLSQNTLTFPLSSLDPY